MTIDQPVSPRLAIIIPVYKHSVLLVDALESALNQQTDFGIHIVIVNDGCPFVETDAVCREYAVKYPEKITYLYKKNGGLSDARNYGLRYVLENFERVEAMYMLDADNVLLSTSMSRAMAVLDGDPSVDWVYPDIEMFGLAWSGSYGGDYSLLIHTAMNICEAGSLIRRRVFEAGVFFDTNFKMGWEDWDFFLSAASHGFRGRNLEHFGFRYRKRPESMLADSNRDQASLSGAMFLKHKALMSPRSLLQLEHKEAPRYAVYFPDEREILYCVDPIAEVYKTVSIEEYEADYWAASIEPGRHRTPPFLIVISRSVFDALNASGLLHWVFWRLEAALRQRDIAALTVIAGDENEIEICQTDGSDHRRADVLAIGPRLFSAILRDEKSNWIDTLASEGSTPKVEAFTLTLPVSIEYAATGSTAVFDFLALVHRLRNSGYRQSIFLNWSAQEIGIVQRNKEYEIVRKPFSGGVAFPRLGDGRRHVGFLLPLIEFGGVEKVALNIAKAMKAQGWVPHVIMVQASKATLTPEWLDTFESFSFLSESEIGKWDPSSPDYLGTKLPGWAMTGNHGGAVGMMSWLDCAINFHGGAILGIMGQLRRFGVKTVNSLHLNDLTQFNRANGHSFLGIAYEHAFDVFAPCSHQLGDWLHSMGVPRDKIVPVQNAPGFELSNDAVAALRARRQQAPEDRPLRVLYLGRLDRQKGLERLVAVIDESRRRKMNVEWRVIGKSVMEDADATLLAQLPMVEPPIHDPEELAAAYAWADVLVLMSNNEGLPLTILEAMRSGVVPVVTNVGANSEVIRSGRNGVLVPLANAVAGCLQVLDGLAKDRARLKRMAHAASKDRQGYDWNRATEGLADKLDILLDL